jgi:hypothetical protein
VYAFGAAICPLWGIGPGVPTGGLGVADAADERGTPVEDVAMVHAAWASW